MKSVARALELSLAVHSRSGVQAQIDHRREELAGLTGAIERRLGLGLDDLAANHRSAATTLLSGLSMVIGRMRYVGNGAFVSVYKKGDEVLKVYRHTAEMDEQSRNAYMESRAQMCDNLAGILGPLVAAQTVGIETHPLGVYRVVMGRQPYIEGGSLDFFATNTLDLKQDAVSAYCERQAEGQAHIRELAEATYRSDDEFREVPDLNGVDNFRLVGPHESIHLIDAEPVSVTEHPGVHDLILRQAEILARFVDAA